MANNFDFEAALKQLQSGQPLTGENGILTPLIKQLTEAALNAEIENYLEENPKPTNRRNGYSRKTVKSSSGSFELETPRDRTGDFEPQLVKKNQTNQADLIFESAAVYTADAKGTQAQAIAVKDGKIVYVGNNAGLQSWRGEDTRIINLQGKSLLPGFVDTHNHAYLRAESMYWVTLTTPSLEGYKQETQAFLATQPEAKQIRGVGWNLKYILEQAAATGRSPAQLLDDIVGKDIPAVFITHGHHEVWANTRAMQNAGITKATPNPPGAFIDRDPVTGEPTGILREFGAQNLVISALPQPDFSVDEYKNAILSFQQDLAPQRNLGDCPDSLSN